MSSSGAKVLERGERKARRESYIKQSRKTTRRCSQTGFLPLKLAWIRLYWRRRDRDTKEFNVSTPDVFVKSKVPRTWRNEKEDEKAAWSRTVRQHEDAVKLNFYPSIAWVYFRVLLLFCLSLSHLPLLLSSSFFSVSFLMKIPFVETVELPCVGVCQWHLYSVIL